TTDHAFFALFALFLATGAVSLIYYKLKDQDQENVTLLERIVLHVPFSLYHAWIFALLIVNVFAVVSPIHEDGPSVFQIVLSIAGLCFIASTVIGYIEYKQGDVAGALVLSWYLFGVFAYQDQPTIHWTSLGLCIAVTAYTLKPLVLRLFGRQTGETAPLLG
ncbi:hypothetical protein BGX21_005129, partial [Mortierella sp. AD011]